jgi:hypothetical protein
MKANRFALASLIAAVLAALVEVFAPLYSTCGSGAGCGSATSLSVNGTWILVVVSVPVVLALVPTVLRSRSARTVSAVLLWACCVVGLASVGMFFIPAAVLMTIAASQREPVPMSA